MVGKGRAEGRVPSFFLQEAAYTMAVAPHMAHAIVSTTVYGGPVLIAGCARVLCAGFAGTDDL